MMHPQAFCWFHGPFLFVNDNGERFMCEDTWVQGKSLAINRQNICDTLFEGVRKPATNIFPPIIDDDSSNDWQELEKLQIGPKWVRSCEEAT